eukprot:TRINITY_DN8156_c0_g1_i1.p1 TRINITY_DN8156_c0_g1~~TRINITY_DN8156_c0_g1_i1.p1  ORF type:complete len:108 (-),score=31.39 TRINITY_DN8156_c0_g1_i1:96-419(-)
MLSPIIMQGHFAYICDDIEECKPATKTFVPSCEACTVRINGVTDALAWQETIDAWIPGLQNEWFCDYQPDPEQCSEAIAFLIPLALPILVDQPRDWVDNFCTEWGAC